ncbi:hypothetical protein ABZX63_13910 [Streptomyces tendae]|uniref:hypothetical protein n=1 Tax=Streptomyces tendae TaxID=1932 RepID=UPI0031F7E147
MSTWVGRRTASSAPVRAVAPEGVHAAADLVGTEEAVDVSVELVPDRSRIASIAGHERGARAGIKLPGGVPGADPGTEIRRAARLHSSHRPRQQTACAS